MFRKYGFIGIFLLLFAQLNFIFKIQPFADWYIPIIWLGYIFVVDAIVFKLKKESLIASHSKRFIWICLLSVVFWAIFEIYNLYTQNWIYSDFSWIIHAVDFLIIMPAIFETADLLNCLKIFNHLHLKKHHKITKEALYSLIILGVIFTILPFIFPKEAFFTVWLGFFLILDPINYLHNQPSLIRFIANGKLRIPVILFLGGIICGILFEFWNFYAVPKWIYNIPYVGIWKVFEMPLLGYFGYGPFAFELFSMYWFIESLFHHKKHILKENKEITD